MAARPFKRGIEFPNEGFVQGAIENFFRARGFTIEEHRRIDLVCAHPQTGEKWRVEAKGLTTAIGLDFRTGIGQLVQGMESRDTKHGLAVPDIPQFRRQVQAVPAWVAETLNLNWLFVGADGAVAVEQARSNLAADSDQQQQEAASPHLAIARSPLR